jgi:hypothetical protein
MTKAEQTNNAHRLTGVILLVLAVVITLGMIAYSIASVVLYVMALTVPGCSAFMPIVVTPLMILGMGVGVFSVLVIRRTVVGTIIFFCSIVFIPTLVPMIAPHSADSVCHAFASFMQSSIDSPQ